MKLNVLLSIANAAGKTKMIEIDYQQLHNDTLENLLTEIVLREGTDYGEVVYSTEAKVRQLKFALEQGRAVIVFDSKSGHCDVAEKRD